MRVRSMSAPVSAMSEASVRIVRLQRWASPAEAASALGISERQLRRKAAAGLVERRRVGGRSEYQIPSGPVPDTMSGPTSDPRPDVRPVMSGHETDASDTPDAMSGRFGHALEAMRAELATVRAALVDAERRAAVAEYRADLAESADVDTLRADLERVTAERDAARDRVRSLRTGTIARLARRVAGLTQGG